MGIGDLVPAMPPTLSGGQAQRVALARALVFEPAALLLDEPMSVLDAEGRMNVRSEVRRLLNEFDGVTLIVTHDPLDILGLADRVVVLDGGRVAQDGTPKQMRRHPYTRHTAALVGRNVVRGQAQGHRVDFECGVTVTTEDVHEGPVDALTAELALDASVWVWFDPAELEVHPAPTVVRRELAQD